ncbi:MAG TPA: hypothetical protein ENI32_04185 [Candidatus Syntrophoarchaeum butanivorans]|uniref:p-loop ATPase/GTPase-like protein n=1 Tax=Candidatus Syntropharchaeum butanivorans TaxID=1839936 RepID=A0A1F2P7A6_9EURY|nr:MAG: P-loop ATPase/GTPase-like protein [Candidatus Syntrophoarchaeum butanivorans]HEC57068.1 hypothetical protein [Candidatus Syntrophoarchaeum butanivorans]
MKKILIAGTREKDAGKTTIACGLLSYLKEIGIGACGFKPRAGNSIWYDFEIIYEAFSERRCYGKDARLLRLHSGVDLQEEIINPVHRLWAEPPSFIDHLQLPPFICDRVRTPEGEDVFIVNATLPFAHGAEDLLRRVDKKIYVSQMGEFNQIISQLYDRATHAAHETISNVSDVIVYESYSDIALPWKGIKDLDLVLVVEPGHISTYDPERYLTAVRLVNRREISTRSVVELLKPIETVRIPPSRSREMIKVVQDRIDLLLKKTERKLDDCVTLT